MRSPAPLALLTILGLLASMQASAQVVPDTAATKAAISPDLPLRSGDPITILRADGTREKGTFRAVADDPPRLLVAREHARDWGGWRKEIPFAEMAAVESRGEPVFHERRILVGTMVGMLVGGVVGFVIGDGPTGYAYPAFEGISVYDGYGSDGRASQTVKGMQAGSLFGLLLGVLFAPSHGPNRTWTFAEAGADSTNSFRNK